TNITVTALTASFILYTRSAGVVYFALGSTACMFSVKLVKRLIRQERPVTQRSEKKRKKSYGMPSTHSASIAFYATFIPLACIYLPIHNTLPQSWFIRVIPPLIVWPWATLIALSRILLGHHTVPQVAVGWAYGVTFAFFWFYMWTGCGMNKVGNEAEQMWNSYLELWR
ncbi:hypothetical protein BDP27DRAFT_1222057, partial [Rhodocollybia butyracea]